MTVCADLAVRMEVVPFIRRRELLQRDPEPCWKLIIEGWRKRGWSTSEICFALNMSRGKLWHLENGNESEPTHSDGEAILKLDKRICESRPKTGT